MSDWRDAGVVCPVFGSSALAEVSSPLSSVRSCKTQRSTPFLARQRGRGRGRLEEEAGALGDARASHVVVPR